MSNEFAKVQLKQKKINTICPTSEDSLAPLSKTPSNQMN